MIIVGAGLAGLIAGNLIPGSTVFEANSALTPHRAVLRFRTPAVGDAVGIPFRKVTVHKGIWRGGFVQPSIRDANLYSQKVTGAIADRSIWKTETEDRWIAPEKFQEMLAENLRNRLELGRRFDFEPGKLAVISTAPMPVMARMFHGVYTEKPEFKSREIYVRRYRVVGANVYQTIYFPDPRYNVYRASITKDVLSVEFTGGSRDACADEVDTYVLRAFGVSLRDVLPIDDGVQAFGKILPIDEQWRRNFILALTTVHKIYSLGRFATWRNILLDDVLNDIAVIKKLNTGGYYDAKLASIK